MRFIVNIYSIFSVGSFCQPKFLTDRWNLLCEVFVTLKSIWMFVWTTYLNILDSPWKLSISWWLEISVWKLFSTSQQPRGSLEIVPATGWICHIAPHDSWSSNWNNQLTTYIQAFTNREGIYENLMNMVLCNVYYFWFIL